MRSSREEVLGLLHEDVAADVGDGLSERELLRAGLYAVLGEAALLNAAVAGQGAQTLFLEDLAGRVIVEELDLGDGSGADKVRIFIELRTDFHAAAATDAIGERVVGLLLLRKTRGPSLDRMFRRQGPRLDGHEVVEENGAVDLQIAYEGKLAERLDLDRLFQIIHERGAAMRALPLILIAQDRRSLPDNWNRR